MALLSSRYAKLCETNDCVLSYLLKTNEDPELIRFILANETLIGFVGWPTCLKLIVRYERYEYLADCKEVRQITKEMSELCALSLKFTKWARSCGRYFLVQSEYHAIKECLAKGAYESASLILPIAKKGPIIESILPDVFENEKHVRFLFDNLKTERVYARIPPIIIEKGIPDIISLILSHIDSGSLDFAIELAIQNKNMKLLDLMMTKRTEGRNIQGLLTVCVKYDFLEGFVALYKQPYLYSSIPEECACSPLIFFHLVNDGQDFESLDFAFVVKPSDEYNLDPEIAKWIITNYPHVFPMQQLFRNPDLFIWVLENVPSFPLTGLHEIVREFETPHKGLIKALISKCPLFLPAFIREKARSKDSWGEILFEEYSSHELYVDAIFESGFFQLVRVFLSSNNSSSKIPDLYGFVFEAKELRKLTREFGDEIEIKGGYEQLEYDLQLFRNCKPFGGYRKCKENAKKKANRENNNKSFRVLCNPYPNELESRYLSIPNGSMFAYIIDNNDIELAKWLFEHIKRRPEIDPTILARCKSVEMFRVWYSDFDFTWDKNTFELFMREAHKSGNLLILLEINTKCNIPKETQIAIACEIGDFGFVNEFIRICDYEEPHLLSLACEYDNHKLYAALRQDKYLDDGFLKYEYQVAFEYERNVKDCEWDMQLCRSSIVFEVYMMSLPDRTNMSDLIITALNGGKYTVDFFQRLCDAYQTDWPAPSTFGRLSSFGRRVKDQCKALILFKRWPLETPEGFYTRLVSAFKDKPDILKDIANLRSIPFASLPLSVFDWEDLIASGVVVINNADDLSFVHPRFARRFGGLPSNPLFENDYEDWQNIMRNFMIVHLHPIVLTNLVLEYYDLRRWRCPKVFRSMHPLVESESPQINFVFNSFEIFSYRDQARLLDFDLSKNKKRFIK